jgi:hypothetical protein
MEIPSGALVGIRFKCAKGHEWESAVGGVWLQMPTCPECKPEMTVPAVAWIGRWEYMPNTGAHRMAPAAGASTVPHLVGASSSED